MHIINTVRWCAILLHAIVIIFGIVIILPLSDGNLLAVFNEANHDPVMKQIASLSLFVIGGNLVGMTLLLSPLFNNIFGFYILLGYEVLLTVGTFFFLSVDYSIVSCLIVVGLLYILKDKRSAKR